MSDTDPSGPVPSRPPRPRASRWASIPWVWAVPALALLIAGWLGLRALAERGPGISITFETADGVEAGRTRIRYKNVDLGTVTQIRLSRDRSHVIVGAEMNREASEMLRSDTKFWVVRPRVGLAGVSGLTTLVSGAYIGVLPGQANQSESTFTGLEKPPPQQGIGGGREYVLVSNTLPSVSDEAPVYFHGVQVGEVSGQKLNDRDGTVEIRFFIYEQHLPLIHDSSRFWVSSGLQVSAGSSGITLGVESLRTLLAGGLIFDTPPESMTAPASRAGTRFRLFADRTAAEDAADPVRVFYQLTFPGSMRGVEVNTPVELRGIRVGRVSAVKLEYDSDADKINIPVTIEVAPHLIGIASGTPFPPKPVVGAPPPDVPGSGRPIQGTPIPGGNGNPGMQPSGGAGQNARAPNAARNAPGTPNRDAAVSSRQADRSRRSDQNRPAPRGMEPMADANAGRAAAPITPQPDASPAATPAPSSTPGTPLADAPNATTSAPQPGRGDASGNTPSLQNQQEATEQTNRMMERLVVKGLRGQIGSGSLITGQKVVALDIVEDAEPATIIDTKPYPQLPTIGGGGLEDVTKSASRLMDKLAALPYAELVGNVRQLVIHADAVVGAPELKSSLKSLDRTLANFDRISHDAAPKVEALLSSLSTASDQLKTTLSILGVDPRASTDLARTMEELRNAARSVRLLADYLERNPSSLIAGK